VKDADRSFIHIETSLHAEQPVALSSLCSLSTETEASLSSGKVIVTKLTYCHALQRVLFSYRSFRFLCTVTRPIIFSSYCAFFGTIPQERVCRENCLCLAVLCTIIMVHKDTNSSYRSVNCIGL